MDDLTHQDDHMDDTEDDWGYRDGVNEYVMDI
jgi:hypothetical protein